ncbi:CAP domain-containing protein [Rhodoblastus sp. 17X3]|uniref:CAP domain-containing protein n=1 Tax=Rhodoblastus sp. 17X3 TaxID=3047026 RepID=UPI0024B69118|nr:CAP domain-containing protein [Rhodoblastus sp. 17X3]MDI9848931.1 CAP domain-containing protein [Rhodoblastus sp. 17X3]
MPDRRFSTRLVFGAAPLCLLLAGCADTAAPPPPAASESSLYRSMAAPGASLDAAAARDMISLYRRNNGLGGLTLDPGLMEQARAQAQTMAARDKLSHELSGSLTARLNGAGFQKSAAVENVSAGYDTMAEVFSGWRQSPSHNANLLAPGMKRMGVAAAYNPKTRYKVFWALVMAN